MSFTGKPMLNYPHTKGMKSSHHILLLNAKSDNSASKPSNPIKTRERGCNLWRLEALDHTGSFSHSTQITDWAWHRAERMRQWRNGTGHSNEFEHICISGGKLTINCEKCRPLQVMEGLSVEPSCVEGGVERGQRGFIYAPNPKIMHKIWLDGDENI